MLDEAGVKAHAKRIAALNNISEELAEKYLWYIGDTPELVSADSDLVIVYDDNDVEIARIKLPMDES